MTNIAEDVARYAAKMSAVWADQNDGAHDIGHLERVWANAQIIAAAEGVADLDVLAAACWFHDAVNLPKDAPDRAAASRLSADLAVTYLRETDFAADKLASVHHAVVAHSFSAGIEPQSPEACILQDADRLEALGAIGLARMFLVSGAMGGGLFDAQDPLAKGRALDDRRFALDHLEVKLFPVARAMRTAKGREMAAERVVFMQAFRDQLLREIG
jgi:uncharacterized protein